MWHLPTIIKFIRGQTRIRQRQLAKRGLKEATLITLNLNKLLKFEALIKDNRDRLLDLEGQDEEKLFKVENIHLT